ncbi:helix-turn-helix domain-containing protein [Bacteroides sp. KH365_2]|uniref:Helix-turn-helix domain-containing protein n=2 Tax=Bacteroides muris (ex Fokt et al. 2023) TaxID=2937417 RepID=A0A9X2NWL8_9BACE|nr:helix-turn-helix domain-containing protein [Bacteroides muris (ex Fokt et al. 2023)]
MSPKEIIDRQIVMEIKRMLISTDLSAKEIADRFHFDSTSYMGRYFRRHTGMTPTEFREQ